MTIIKEIKTKECSDNSIYFEIDPKVIQRRYLQDRVLSYLALCALILSIIVLTYDKIILLNINNLIKIIKLLILTSPISIILVITFFVFKSNALSINRCAILPNGFYPQYKPYKSPFFRSIIDRKKYNFKLIKEHWFVKWSDILEIIEFKPTERGPFYCELRLKNGIQFNFTSTDLYLYFKRKDHDRDISKYENLMRQAFKEINDLIQQKGAVPEDYRFSPQ